MKFKSYHEGAADFRAWLWVAFWLYIVQAGDPDLLTVIIEWIGRH